MMAANERMEAVKALVEKYRRQLFPGLDSDKNKDFQIERAKRLLVEETKKIYMVRKIEGVEALKDTLEKAKAAGRHDFAKAAEYEVYKADMAQAKLKKRMQETKAKKERSPPKR